MDREGHTLGRARQSKRRSDSDASEPFKLPIVPNHIVHVHHVPRLARQPYVHLPQLTKRLLREKKIGPNTVLDQQKAFQVGRL